MLSVWQWAGAVAGGLVVFAGLYVMRFSRTRADTDAGDTGRAERGVLEGLLGRTSVSTRAAIGLSLLVLGYHLVAYSLPHGWLWLRVPADRLWILGVAVGVVVVGSLVMDGAERRF